MNKMKYVFILLGLFIVPLAFCSTKAIVSNNAKSTAVVEKVKPQNDNFNEAETYRLLYENTKYTNDKILSITQWTIGIVISIMLAILFSQIFFNYRINKAEVDFIKKDLDEKLTLLKSEMVKAVEDKEKLLNNLIDEKNNTIEKELKDNIKTQYETKAELLKAQIELLVKDIKDDLHSLRIDTEKNTGDIWLIEGVERNALACYLQTAKLQIEAGREVKYILEDIIEILSKLDEILEIDYNMANALLSKLPAKYNIEIEKIRALYKDKPIFNYTDEDDPTTGRPQRIYIKNKEK